MSDILIHPISIFRTAASPQTRPYRVSCFLRGPAGDFPRKWMQGYAYRESHGVVWSPALRFRHDPVSLPTWSKLEERHRSKGDWNIKRGLFMMLVCRSDATMMYEVAIPKVSYGAFVRLFRESEVES